MRQLGFFFLVCVGGLGLGVLASVLWFQSHLNDWPGMVVAVGLGTGFGLVGAFFFVVGVIAFLLSLGEVFDKAAITIERMRHLPNDND